MISTSDFQGDASKFRCLQCLRCLSLWLELWHWTHAVIASRDRNRKRSKHVEKIKANRWKTAKQRYRKKNLTFRNDMKFLGSRHRCGPCQRSIRGLRMVSIALHTSLQSIRASGRVALWTRTNGRCPAQRTRRCNRLVQCKKRRSDASDAVPT